MDSGSLLVAGHVLRIVDGAVTSSVEELYQAKAALRMKLASGTSNDQEIAFLVEFIRLAKLSETPEAPKLTLEDAIQAAKIKILTEASNTLTLEQKIAAARARLTK